MHEAHETACAVAALLHLGPVGVEDAIAKVGVGTGGRLDQEDLVAADTEVPVGDEAQLLWGQRHALTDAVEDDEVVAQPVHLGELEFHAGIRAR